MRSGYVYLVANNTPLSFGRVTYEWLGYSGPFTSSTSSTSTAYEFIIGIGEVITNHNPEFRYLGYSLRCLSTAVEGGESERGLYLCLSRDERNSIAKQCCDRSRSVRKVNKFPFRPTATPAGRTLA